MDNVGYVSLSALTALRKTLDVTANNVANMNTTGFKSDRMVFSEVVSQVAGEQKDKGVSFVQDKHTWTDFTAGNIRHTNTNLDVAIIGDGFIAVETPDGVSYTRDGRFQINVEGTLVNNEGYPILNADFGQIQLPANTESLYFAKDGTITANNATIGRLGVFSSNNPAAMTKAANSGFKSETELQLAENIQISQGMLEDSNVNGIIEMTKLVDITRAYNNADSLAQNADALRKDAISRIGRV